MIFKTVILFFCTVILTVNLLFSQADTIQPTGKKIAINLQPSAILFNSDKSEVSGTIDFLPEINIEFGKNSLSISPYIGKVILQYPLAPLYKGRKWKGFFMSYQRRIMQLKKTELYVRYCIFNRYIHFKSDYDNDVNYGISYYGNYSYLNYSLSNALAYELKQKILGDLFLLQSTGFGWSIGKRVFDFDKNQFDNTKNTTGISWYVKIGVGYNLYKK